MANKKKQNIAPLAQEEAPNWSELTVAFNETASIIKGTNDLLLLALTSLKEAETTGSLDETAIKTKREFISAVSETVKGQIVILNEVKKDLKPNAPVTANDYQEFFNLSTKLMNVSVVLDTIDISKLTD